MRFRFGASEDAVPIAGPTPVRHCLMQSMIAASPAEGRGAPKRRNTRLSDSLPTGSSLPTETEAEEVPNAPQSEKPLLMTYRSVGLGVWGAVLRFVGMPLEKLALFMNSSQVSGSGQLGQAWKLVFADGPLAPFKVVGRASIVAWFFQYALPSVSNPLLLLQRLLLPFPALAASWMWVHPALRSCHRTRLLDSHRFHRYSAMGLVFQGVDLSLSTAFGVDRVQYGAQLMAPVDTSAPPPSPNDMVRQAVKTTAAPVISGTIESCIANRAEVQRYFGLDKFAEVQKSAGAFTRAFGPAFLANATRNAVMSSTSFVLTPITYKHFFPQERKSQSTLFWYGLAMNIFVGNVVAINLQALWGRSLDSLAANGRIHYRGVIDEGLRKEGIGAFITPSKWFSRVLMNAPAQGTLPWFYNECLPLGEGPIRSLAARLG